MKILYFLTHSSPLQEQSGSSSYNPRSLPYKKQYLISITMSKSQISETLKSLNVVSMLLHRLSQLDNFIITEIMLTAYSLWLIRWLITDFKMSRLQMRIPVVKIMIKTSMLIIQFCQDKQNIFAKLSPASVQPN